MPRYEYKVVPAPHQGRKDKSAKGPAERFAGTLEAVMNDLGAEGWEYARADALPCEERRGLTGTRVTMYHVLVFRRALPVPDEVAPVRDSTRAAGVAGRPGAPDPDAARDATPDLGAGPQADPRPRRSAWGAVNPAPLVAGGGATGTDPRTGRLLSREAGGTEAGGPAAGPALRRPPLSGAEDPAVTAAKPAPGRIPQRPSPSSPPTPPAGPAMAEPLTGPAARAARLLGSARQGADIAAAARAARAPDAPPALAAPLVGGPPRDEDRVVAAARGARQRATDATTAARAAAAALRLYHAGTAGGGGDQNRRR